MATDTTTLATFPAKLLPAQPGNQGARAWRRLANDRKLGFAVNQVTALAACQEGEYGLFILLEEQDKRWKGEFVRKV